MMRKKTLILSILCFAASFLSAQSDSIDYKNLKIVQNYKYSDWVNWIDDCRPCLVEYYDEKRRLTARYVQDGDCIVGKFIEYYKNGNIKVKGGFIKSTYSYRCSYPHGEWTYYKENGAPKYKEFWNKGVFLRQLPEQKQSEIWEITLHLDDKRMDTTLNIPINVYKLKDLINTPKYKNSNADPTFYIELKTSSTGRYKATHKFTLENFNEL